MPTTNKNNAENVSVGKGVAGGYIFSAPIGTALPTDYSTALDPAYKNLGFISDEGISNAVANSSSDPFRDFNGDTVSSAAPSKTETLTVSYIEIKADTLKEVYGQDNVKDEEGMIVVEHTNDEMPHRVLVLELVLKNGRRWRRVLPNAQVTAWDTMTLVYTDLIKLPVTYTANADAEGRPMYDYIQSTETQKGN